MVDRYAAADHSAAIHDAVAAARSEATLIEPAVLVAPDSPPELVVQFAQVCQAALEDHVAPEALDVLEAPVVRADHDVPGAPILPGPVDCDLPSLGSPGYRLATWPVDHLMDAHHLLEPVGCDPPSLDLLGCHRAAVAPARRYVRDRSHPDFA